MPQRLPVAVLLLLIAALAPPARAIARPPSDPRLLRAGVMFQRVAEPVSDTLSFRPAYDFFDSTGHEPLVVPPPERLPRQSETEWLRAPVGDLLLDHPDEWATEHHHRGEDLGGVLDYNRVDLLRFGLHYQAQHPRSMDPRLGARFEYSTGRDRTLYGLQLEQPLFPTARFVFGVNLVRRTDHPELQQVDDVENSVAMLLARTDYRDYWEREGGGVYVSWRVPDFSTVSLHVRRDKFRSLTLDRGVRSWFHQSSALRDNPAIDDGETHSVLVRLERLARRSSSTRAGLYHWIEFERAGSELGGDFDYSRILGDLRSVVRMSPATSLSLRAVGGTCTDGSLPRQKRFELGGVDGLRGHPMGAFSGNQLAAAQAEYTVGLWALRGTGFEPGLHAIAFLDTGTAWDDAHNLWNVGRQRFATDGGFGLSTSEDDLRLYVARDLQHGDAPVVWSLRLRRPF